MKYFTVQVTKRAKHIGELDFMTYDQEKKDFATIEEVKEFLGQYAGNKRKKMYNDGQKGEPLHVGYVYSFRFEPSSYGEKHGYEEHWVEIREVEAKTVIITAK